VLSVTRVTAPEPEPLLCRFYRAVRPRGWWAPVARRCGLPPQRLGAGPWLVVAAGVLGVYGVLLGAGSALLGSAWLGAGAAALGFVCIGAAVRAKLPGA
jgi:hypothetical protein